MWLEPYPDLLIDELPDRAAGPEAAYGARAAMSLAFVTALQLLPPRQPPFCRASSAFTGTASTLPAV